MRRILQIVLVALALIAPQTSHAASSAQKLLLLSGCPAQARVGGLCPTGPSLNFAAGFYWVPGQGSVPYTSLISTSRASQETCTNSAGLLTYAANNVPCITDLGLQVWEGRTNDALWARDMTNAAWVKVNMTAALNAVGADGAANSASTLTATAGNATILQTITLGSGADTYSVYLKRVTGTGTINITENGGTAWTACPALSTTAFTRCTLTSTLANPVFGVQIVTNGDSVIADFNQLEPGGFASPPIPTTTTSAARAADNITATGALLSAFNYLRGSVISQFNTSPGGSPAGVWAFNDGTGSNRIDFRNNQGGLIAAFITVGGVNQANPNSGVGGSNLPVKGALAWALGTNQIGIAQNNNAVVDATAASLPSSASAVRIGAIDGGSNYLNNYLQRLTVFNSRLPDATLKAMTQ